MLQAQPGVGEYVRGRGLCGCVPYFYLRRSDPLRSHLPARLPVLAVHRQVSEQRRHQTQLHHGKQPGGQVRGLRCGQQVHRGRPGECLLGPGVRALHFRLGRYLLAVLQDGRELRRPGVCRCLQLPPPGPDAPPGPQEGRHPGLDRAPGGRLLGLSDPEHDRVGCHGHQLDLRQLHGWHCNLEGPEQHGGPGHQLHHRELGDGHGRDLQAHGR